MTDKMAGYETFQRRIKDLTGLDLTAYKEKQMLRRLFSYLDRLGLKNFLELAKQIETDQAALEQLEDYLTINVSEFFRDPVQFERLAQVVLPDLLQKHHHVSVWSAACSIGAEPYSVAILFHEAGASQRYSLLGTDVDRRALREAKEGVYDEAKLKNVSPLRRRKFFTLLDDGRWRVAEFLRQNITWKVHDLTRDSYPVNQHLILCRNVIIYFTESVKDAVFQRLAAALAPGGYLLLGSTESLFGADRLGLEGVAPFLYRKRQPVSGN